MRGNVLSVSMKRFAYAGTMLLVVIVIGVPATQAETAQPAAVKAVISSEMSALDLACLVYRGYFREQGIPGYGTLSNDHRSRRIRAKDVVQAAVKINRLSEQKLSDRALLNEIDTNL